MFSDDCDTSCNECGYTRTIQHSTAYSASGNTITETCSKNCGHSVDAILTAADTTYTGDPIITGATIAYPNGWQGEQKQPSEIADTEYTNNINAGTATVTTTVEGKELTTTFKINAASISGEMVTLSPENGTYTGSAYAPSVNVTFNGASLVKDRDYTISWNKTGFTTPDTYTVRIVGVNNFTGFVDKTFTINAASLSDVKVEQVGTLTYNGEEQTPTVSTSATSVNNQPITFEYSTEQDNYGDMPTFTEAGTYTVYYRATADNHIAAYGEFKVTINKQTVDVPDISSKEYNGETQTADVESTDLYTVTENNGGKDAGKYNVELTLTDSNNYKWENPETTENGAITLDFEITKATNKWTTEPSISGWTYGETASTPNGVAKFGTVVVTYKGTTITGKEYPESTTPPTEAGSYTATFTVAGTDNYSELSGTKDFTVSVASIKDAMVTASDVAYTGKEQKPTVTVTLGGKTLTENTDYTVSYSDNTDLGTATVTVTGKGNYTDSATGNFKINYLATDAEAAVSGEQGAKDWYIGTVTLTAPDGYTISKDIDGSYAETISYGDELNDTVTYYLKNANGEIAPKTYELKIDLTDPTAQYSIKDNGWRSFVNFISFGIFCKDNADLAVQASDTMDSSVTVEYVISTTELNAEDITAWNTYTGKVALNPQAKNYIYIRVTDDAGRAVVYKSGVVVFSDCSKTVNLEYYKDTHKDVAAQITFNGNTVKEVKYGDTPLTGEQYTVTDDGITFAAAYLDTFEASDTPYTFTVSYHPMGVEMGTTAEGDTPANTTVSLAVKKQSGEVSNISELGKDYDGSAVSAPTYTSKSTGEATVLYKLKGTDDATYSETAPKDAGTYIVRVTVGSDENYKEAYATAEFTISKVTLTVTAEDKAATYGDKAPDYTVTYDGFKGDDDKNVLGGTLSFDCDYEQFDDKGEYIITPKGYESGNYNITYIDGKLTVKAKPITVTIDEKSSIYGDDIATLTATDKADSSTYSSDSIALAATDEGIVNQDADVYKLTTSASKTSGVGKYDITGTAIDDNYDITFANGADAYEITPRELTVSVVVADKEYDGLDTATITSAVLNNLANEDKVELVNGTATFERVDAGEDIAISLTDFTLSGEADVLKNYTLTQPTGITASITNDWTPAQDVDYTVNGSGWMNTDFVITAADGYKLSLTDTADGTWEDSLTYTEETDDGSVTFYVKDEADGIISLAKTVTYKIDKTPVTGKVSFDETNSWDSFSSSATFGLLYNDQVTISIDATDDLSDIATIQYVASDKAMTLDEVKAISDSKWSTYTDGINVTPEDGMQFVYYVRITDQAGNVTYLSTDGAEYDLSAPAVNGIADGATYYTTQKITVTDKNIESITVNGEAVTDTITLEGNKAATYTVVTTDKAGNETSVTITMKPISDLSKPIDTLTKDNVSSSNEQAVDGVKAALAAIDMTYATDEEKAALKNISDKATELDTAIDAIKAEENKTASGKDNSVTGNSPGTGDNGNPWLWLALMLLSGMGILGLALNERKIKTIDKR